MYSIFDIFKVSIGPSSSHTMGPMVAAKHFRDLLVERNDINKIQAKLYGSLAYTGRAHGSEKGIVLGLEGFSPETITTQEIKKRVSKVKRTKLIKISNQKSISFDIEKNIVFDTKTPPMGHSNTLEIMGFKGTEKILSRTYHSVGGGFIRVKGERKRFALSQESPYEFDSCNELLELCKKSKLDIDELTLKNELSSLSKTQLRKKILSIWAVMDECIENGLKTEGILEGGLNVKRRAANIYKTLTKSRKRDPLKVMDFVNVYAMAVNEENASGGKVVTAPTNGAAGIIPAVIRYYLEFTRNSNKEGVIRFLLTAGSIGILYKKNASISGAEVGCQGEVGVACSMAAGGLVSALGGSNKQIESAAEIGMEHNLGLTCDPIKGLVQIPCIERNAMGAVKSINAARLSMLGKGTQKVTLDQVIKTMMDTGKDMQAIYKETAMGGLAVNVVEC
jgi:L-serine dehydratase